MIDDMENKIKNFQLQECSLKIDPFGSYFARNIYETVTLGLCYLYRRLNIS